MTPRVTVFFNLEVSTHLTKVCSEMVGAQESLLLVLKSLIFLCLVIDNFLCLNFLEIGKSE